MGDHGIVDRISVFGDVEIFLDNTPHVGEERPVGANSAAIFIRLSNIVGANRDKPAIGNLELTMKFKAKAVKEMLKPKTLDELFEELDLEMAED